jgi:hypothetical protein
MSSARIAVAVVGLVMSCLVLTLGAATDTTRLACVVVIDITRSNLAELNTTDVRDAVGFLIQDHLRSDLVSLVAVTDPLGSPTPLSVGQTVKQRDVDRSLSANDSARYGGSPLWDAMLAGIDLLSKRPVGTTPVLFVYSDGEVSADRASLDDVESAVLRAGVHVAVVFHTKRQQVLPQATSGILVIKPDLQLKRLVASTGGVFSATPATYTEALRIVFGRTLEETRKHIERPGRPSGKSILLWR